MVNGGLADRLTVRIELDQATCAYTTALREIVERFAQRHVAAVDEVGHVLPVLARDHLRVAVTDDEIDRLPGFQLLGGRLLQLGQAHAAELGDVTVVVVEWEAEV